MKVDKADAIVVQVGNETLVIDAGEDKDSEKETAGYIRHCEGAEKIRKQKWANLNEENRACIGCTV